MATPPIGNTKIDFLNDAAHADKLMDTQDSQIATLIEFTNKLMDRVTGQNQQITQLKENEEIFIRYITLTERPDHTSPEGHWIYTLETEIEDLQQENAALNDLIYEIRDEQEQMDATYSKLQEFKEREVQEVYIELKNDISKYTAQKRIDQILLGVEHNFAQIKIETMNFKLQELSSTLERNSQQITNLQETIVSLEQKNQTLLDNVTSKEETITRLGQACNALKTENLTLVQNLEEANKTIALLKKTLAVGAGAALVGVAAVHYREAITETGKAALNSLSGWMGGK
ncbi:MAG: hypothetical protein ACOYK9_04165 [Chlamydiia bacterium]